MAHGQSVELGYSLAMAKTSSSNEISAYFRSAFPEISGDSLSRKLCTPEGVRLAQDFQKEVYPLVDRHLSVRNRYFFERSRKLIEVAGYDTILSLGSGLSLLTLQLAEIAPQAKLADADLPDVIQIRRTKLQSLNEELTNRIQLHELDIEQWSKTSTSLKSLIGNVAPLIICEGVSYFLSTGALKWIFDEVTAFKKSALIFDYWPHYSTKSETFRTMIQSFKTSIKEEVKTTFSDADLSELSSLFCIEDIELRDAEKLYAPDLQLNDLNKIVPARFRILSTDKFAIT